MSCYSFWEVISHKSCFKEKWKSIFLGEIAQITKKDKKKTKITCLVKREEFVVLLEDKGYSEIYFTNSQEHNRQTHTY